MGNDQEHSQLISRLELEKLIENYKIIINKKINKFVLEVLGKSDEWTK